MAVSSFRTALSVLLASLTFLSAGGYGQTCLRFLGIYDNDPAEVLVFSGALGYGVMALLMMLAGVLHAWTTGGAWGIVGGGLLLSPAFTRTLFSLWPPRFPGIRLPFLFLVICAVGGFLLALAPVTYYDSLVYHLALPSAYKQAGHWISWKELIYPAFPQNLEMLWTMALLMGSDTVANLIGFALTGLMVSATFLFAKRYLSPGTGLVAALLLSMMPAVLLLSSGGYVDGGLTLYVFLGFFSLCRWRETHARAWLTMAAILGGLAMGIKYTAGIPFAISTLLILLEKRKEPVEAMKSGLLFIGIGSLVMSPWLLKNTIYVGNPVFPFFYDWGNTALSPWVKGAAAGYFHGVAEYQPRTLMNLLKLPWDIIAHSLQFGGGMDVLGDFGWAPLLVLLPFSPLNPAKNPTTRWLWSFAGLFVVAWAFSRPVLRFLLPLAPLLALLAAMGWEALSSWRPITQGILKATVVALVLLGFGFFSAITSVIGQFPVALGFVSRDTYLSKKLNYFAAAQVVNQLPPESLTYVVGDQRSYYYNRPIIVTPVFNENPLTTWANQSASPADLGARLKSRGITHLLINELEMKRLDAAYHLFPFTPQGQANWRGLLASQATSLYRDSACEVFALR